MKTQYAVYDNNKPANRKGFPILDQTSIGCWDDYIFASFNDAVEYASKWLGVWSRSFPEMKQLLSNNQKYDYNGYGDFIEIRQITPKSFEITKKDRVFWSIVKACKWRKDKDYKRIHSFIIERYGKATFDSLNNWCHDQQSALMDRLEQYAKEKGHDLCYWGVSDDGFNDLTAHIVGLGVTEYQKVMENPELARKRALKGDYEENFFYCFLE